jgi:aminotransferase
MRIARRLQDLAQSDIRRMTRECERVQGINLGQGICDLPTPQLVREGAIQAIRENRSTYSFAEGARELREAIARKLRRDNGIAADAATEICVTEGASGAYAAAIHALLDPGDGILLLEPYYGYHLNAARVAGLVPEFLALQPPDFKLDESALARAITPRTRAIVVCTPSNPSGKMFTREELLGLARVAEERDLLVITDEIYEYIRYDGREHISPASLPALRERTVSIMGLSKTFSITGWRLGYAVAPEPLTKATSLGKATSREAAMDVLERARVASIPGSAFYRGETGEKLLRFCFAKEDDVLDEACRRLRALR